ncbi:SGNH hydrolase-type esterase domain-containing protein [Tanacetum coccineum]
MCSCYECLSTLHDFGFRHGRTGKGEPYLGGDHKFVFAAMATHYFFIASLCRLSSDAVLISLTLSLYNPDAVTNNYDAVFSHCYLLTCEKHSHDKLVTQARLAMFALASSVVPHEEQKKKTMSLSFGDSLADTGSQKELSHISHQLYPCLYSPYGETFFHKPTGRCSNGRLIIDFLAESLGLPMMQPFLHNKHTIDDIAVALRQGVNYAMAGATTLDWSFLEAEWPERTVINASLEVQLTWFKQSLPSICGNTSDCKSFIKSSLILMGEIGGNDYSFPLLAGKSVDEVKPYVHLVTDMIISTVNVRIYLNFIYVDIMSIAINVSL